MWGLVDMERKWCEPNIHDHDRDLWWGGWMYGIVTGVNSDVGVPLTYLVHHGCKVIHCLPTDSHSVTMTAGDFVSLNTGLFGVTMFLSMLRWMKKKMLRAIYPSSSFIDSLRLNNTNMCYWIGFISVYIMSDLMLTPNRDVTQLDNCSLTTWLWVIVNNDVEIR